MLFYFTRMNEGFFKWLSCLFAYSFFPVYLPFINFILVLLFLPILRLLRLSLLLVKPRKLDLLIG
jgi:hypothetical protein